MAEPFTIGRQDEYWHYKLDALVIPIPFLDFCRSADQRESILVVYRSDKYRLICAGEEYATDDLLMMACYVDDFLQRYKDNANADL